MNVDSQRRFEPFAAVVDEGGDPDTKFVPRVQPGIDRFSCGHRITGCWRMCGEFGDEKILVVNNLSSSAQAVELDVQRYKGYIPIEMFGRNLFPRFGDLPYLLTLGPYQFYWFRLRADLTLTV